MARAAQQGRAWRTLLVAAALRADVGAENAVLITRMVCGVVCAREGEIMGSC